MEKTRLGKLASLTSGVSSPFIVGSIFPLIIIASVSHSNTLLLAALFILFGVAVPFVFIWGGVKAGRYTDLHVAVREQRTQPFLVTLVSMAILAGAYLALKAPVALVAMLIAIIVNGIIYLLISQYWKISMHAAVLSGLVTSLAILVSAWFWLLLMLVPPVVWSRLYRKRHTIAQGAAGALLAVMGSYIIFKAFGVVG